MAESRSASGCVQKIGGAQPIEGRLGLLQPLAQPTRGIKTLGLVTGAVVDNPLCLGEQLDHLDGGQSFTPF